MKDVGKAVRPAEARNRAPLHGSSPNQPLPFFFSPPPQTQVGMVFQSYALFNHMTVAENIKFGLEVGSGGWGVGGGGRVLGTVEA
jgi:hypothetical protein